MTSIAFDTLNATKRLRDAGMEERTAEAVVELVQQTARMPDISHLATKDDLHQLEAVTKSDLRQLELATKADLRQLEQATKAELRQMAEATKADLRQLEQTTKAEIQETKLSLRGEIAQLETRLSEKIRMQGWSLISGMAVLLAVFTALGKLIG